MKVMKVIEQALMKKKTEMNITTLIKVYGLIVGKLNTAFKEKRKRLVIRFIFIRYTQFTII